MNQIKGTLLSSQDKEYVLNAFVHRFTGNHMPRWASGNYKKYPHFIDDTDWLENSLFNVTKSNRLDHRFSHCESTQTWPNGRMK